ncbi:MAG: hypothetical protein HYY16_06150 [Planctomycetes bacterium]|nr:hypothetical protein [Planctomycetota bacterium]
MHTILLLATLLADDPITVSVGKSAAAPYRAALSDYRDAEAALKEGKFALAREKAESILENPKIEKEKRDCLLRIQNQDSTWSNPVEFFPLRARGQALLELAKKQLADGNKDVALASLEAARKDLEESASRFVPRSKELAAEVEDLIRTHSAADDVQHAYDAKMKAALQAESQRRHPEARRFFEEALVLKPGDPEARNGLERIDRRIAEEQRYRQILAIQDPQEKLKACDDFQTDFPTSVYRESVTTLRAQLRNELDADLNTREGRFKNVWFELKEKRRFKSALDHVRKEGGFLPPEKRAGYERQTLEACDAFVANVVRDFERETSLLGPPTDLPSGDELVMTDPALECCRTLQTSMIKLRELGPVPPERTIELLTPAWLACLALIDREDTSLIQIVASLLKEPIEQRLRTIARQADQALPQELEKLRAEAERLLAWSRKGLDDALARMPDHGKTWRERHAFWTEIQAALREIVKEFPLEDPAVDATAAELLDSDDPAGPYGASPRKALRQIEDKLNALREVKKLTRYCRRRLLAALIVAAAQRHLLQGQDVPETAKKLTDYAAALRDCGGPLDSDVQRFGPKIEEVFRRLR